MKRMYRLLLPVAIALLLTGCWDRREINDVAFVVATAIDLERVQGEKRYRQSVQIPLPSQLGGMGSQGGGGGTSGGSGKPWYIESKSGKSVREGTERVQKALSRELTFSHRRVLILGEELARDGLEPVIDLLGRIPQNRLSTYFYVARGEAQSILRVDAPVEQTPAETAREMAIAFMKEPRTLKDLTYALLLEGQDPFLPVISPSGTVPGPTGKAQTTLKIDGMAVFAGDKLAGFLDERTTAGALWALGQARVPTVALQVPGRPGRTSIQFYENLTEIRPLIQGESITMSLRIRAKGGIVENNTDLNWASGTNMRQLESLAAKEIASNVEAAVRQLQALGSDALGFGHQVHCKNPALWRRIAPTWRERYPKVKVQVEVIPLVENSGTLTAPFGYRQSEVVR